MLEKLLPMNGEHRSGPCIKVVGDECSKNDPWLVVLERASELLEIATGLLADGGHSFFSTQVKQIQEGIKEQIEGEKAWAREAP